MSGYGDRDRYRDRERDRSRSRSRERGRGYHDRGRDRDYDRPRRISLLVRNLGFDTRQEDVRRLFDKYGEVKDVYIPMNYHTKKKFRDS
ncbi:hypothetical protein NSK_006439 [Nannochloropsis salina CCMP1776]|uniref:RRM domain-containing protein n=1 Tax=Nannochloropsis salina CCMP1776 TaxID=1027361 RepID=A0A4D9CT26_9STRA|nr:hypothetical protein NSK_006439 [Nannochloropsis salina CCMP1776]|eukprot:TFJ82320.1 hypothetical protein NSK_006439 [Nannochloropsis salina CCMP1776]